jgi:pyruvate dehydrogenase E2 component (dihydrolipoamide acetyltransferase)
MVTYVKLPKLTWTMEEGVLGRWLKREEEEVKEGDPVCEIETEKTTDVVKAPASGVLRKILVQEGATAPVNQIIAVITKAEEKIPDLKELEQEAQEVAVEPSATEKERVRNKPAEKKRPRISPLAAKLAKKHGVDVSRIEGSGPGGRITKKDVEAAIEEIKMKEEVIPVQGMRKTIINRLTLSARTALHVPITTEVDVTEMVKLRETPVRRLEAKEEVRITYTDILVKAVANALRRHPIVNSRIEGDRIKLLKEVNVGVAVALEEGLIVPVIRDADMKTIRDTACCRKQLVEKARRGELLTREVSGGTFTVSNLGMFGIDVFAPIINPPESAILGVGRILQKAVVIDGEVTVRPMMTLSLVFDHRVMDGAKAAQFLKTITEVLENPYLLLA